MVPAPPREQALRQAGSSRCKREGAAHWEGRGLPPTLGRLAPAHGSLHPLGGLHSLGYGFQESGLYPSLPKPVCVTDASVSLSSD